MDLSEIKRFKIGVDDVHSLVECCIRCSLSPSSAFPSSDEPDPSSPTGCLGTTDSTHSMDCEYFESLVKLMKKPYARKVVASLQVYRAGMWWMILADLKIGLVFEDEYFKAMYTHWGNEEDTTCPLRRGNYFQPIASLEMMSSSSHFPN
jgi:hypothetical protein